MKNILRTPLFWLSLSVITLLCIVASFKLFSRAFPIVHLNITMDGDRARKQAQQIASNYNLGPAEHQQAIAFQLDNVAKTFVELDAGGKEAFVQMMEQDLYQPYTWWVRHFKPQDQNEVMIYFTPEGKPYGFVETLSEQTPGPSVDEKNARTLAEHTAINDWNIPLSAFHLVESSKEKVSSGRTDHTFVYERSNERIGTGLYRIQLKVSGDKLTTIKNEVKVPEEFTRRYQEMRSANESIAIASNILQNLLYILGGCIIGLFFLWRGRRIIWRPAAFWAILIAGLMAINNINQLPLAWMQYDTALSPHIFLFNYLIITALQFFFLFSLLLLTFSAAEGLTRTAFGHHPQLWKLWSGSAAHSIQVLGRTILGYFSIPFLLLFAITFYIFTSRFLNWWIPSDTLYNPNVLAAYLPWLSSVAISLFAGFREECLFRAVPLACAALIGQRFGRKRLWIVGAFILQALIFGAAHAIYPMQPAYARLVELIIPSFIWGGMYLAFGLLPTIISHVMYDLILFSLPIFVSSTLNSNTIIIILILFIPLWIVLYAYNKAGLWSKLTQADYNAAWQPPEPMPQKPQEVITPTATTPPNIKKSFVFALGLLGLLSWLIFAPFINDAPALTSNRTTAINQASDILKQHYGVDTTKWYPLANTFTSDIQNIEQLKLQRRFIWQEGGKNAYAQLLGTHIMPPYWLIRFVKFEGDTTERAEEYRVYLPNDCSLFLVEHILPESTSGASLSEQRARDLAHTHIKKKFALEPAQLKKISAESTKQPNRLDWTFTFDDPRIYPLEQGQARIKVIIGGDQVASTYRYIHVPQEWERAQRSKQVISSIIKLLSGIGLLIFFIAGTTIIFAQSSLPSVATLWLPFLLFLALILLNFLNAAPLLFAQFNTSEPFYNQVFKFFGMSVFGLLLQAAIYTLTLRMVNRRQTDSKNLMHSTVLLGLSIGCIFAGIYALLQRFIPSIEPLWADYNALGYVSPVIASVYSYLTSYVFTTILLVLFFATIDQYSRNWQRRKIPSGLLMLLSGFIFVGLGSADNVTLFLASGTLTGIALLIAYITTIRFDNSLIILATASYVTTKIMQQAYFNAWPGAWQGAIGALLIIGILAWKWFNWLKKR